jgi:peroxiredoxin
MPHTDDLPAPPDAPIPVDDGACAELEGSPVPPIRFRATTGGFVDLSARRGRSVVFVYPKIGLPGRDNPPGWDDIPGARGCNSQSCRFRDLQAEFATLGAEIFGVSTQSTPYQSEAAAHLRLSYPLLSDEQLELTHGWGLPTFTVQDEVLLKRLTVVLRDGIVEKVFYPVFPPAANADEVLAWLRTVQA